MPREAGWVEIVRFANAPVRIVRGAAPAGTLPVRREIVSFGNGTTRPVTVGHGAGEPVEAAIPATLPTAPPTPQNTVERIAFAGAVQTSVTIVRGIAAPAARFTADPFALSSVPEFDRIAQAVHGAESSYGTDPAMWRPDPDGPQGPMQVSEAAARDIGGGDRFDLEQNRRLGRAYLARMFRRYGNWPEALAAYNWGPANVDRWIAGGRNVGLLPLETIRYVNRVLRDARIVKIIGEGRRTATR
jgi:hypothetical protein